MAALDLEDVGHVYPSGSGQAVALDRVTLTVDDGETVAVVGPSGSGTSTLLAIAGGLLRPTTGTVRVAGVDLGELRAADLTRFRATRLGFVFRAANLLPFLTARENLLVVADLVAPKRRREMGAWADSLLDELGLGERRQHLPAWLTGAERQLVAIGRALMNEPALVLVDEPTAALDTRTGGELMEILRESLRSRGHAAVIATHDHRVTGYADRTIGILDGVLQPGDRPARPDLPARPDTPNRPDTPRLAKRRR